jgi:hypothetical protein
MKYKVHMSFVLFCFGCCFFFGVFFFFKFCDLTKVVDQPKGDLAKFDY